ncbi:MAG TPA: amino-acid N-acetyltransferase [Gammaproteobacteria bacterium]|nr:amino-acid N-acetyltransferase [Gammaproteobacteria bacterium]
MNTGDTHSIVGWFRAAAPYINRHRGKTFVVYFSGEAVAGDSFESLVHDLGLLHALGIRLVLVSGARPQIEARLSASGLKPRYAEGLRITDLNTLDAVLEAVGRLRVLIEARLSLSLDNTPMSGRKISVSSGNFISARPLGVRNGVDFQHTGEVRKVDAEAIRLQLDNHQCVLLSPLGYSPTGEVFNLRAEEVARETAVALKADKLILLGEEVTAASLPTQLAPDEVEPWLADAAAPENMARLLRHAARAVSRGVGRAHLLDRGIDGGLLLELFTRDGVGAMVCESGYEGLRDAVIDDVGGIVELIAPLEAEGVLARRSREQLELDIGNFVVIERDGMIIACSAIYPFPDDGVGEIACLAVHQDYRNQQRGDIMLRYLEKRAVELGLDKLFVLSTHTMHWFIERGYRQASLDDLPVERAALYNYQRRSKIFVKTL